MTLIDKHGAVENVALNNTAHFGGAYEDFLAGMANRIAPPVSNQKVALAIPVTQVTGTQQIVLNPQVDFKGEILILSDVSNPGTGLTGSAGNFTIDSIKVGRDEQLVASGAIPGQVFANGTTQPIGLNMKVCPTSLNITLTVTCLANGPLPFSGVLIGSCGGCNETAQPAPDTGAVYDPLVALAVPVTNVPAKSTVTIPVSVEVPFTGQRLVIPTSFYDATKGVAALSDTSSFFTIDSIKVGRDEMLTSSDPIPATVFAINSPREVGLSMKKCPTSLTINVTVTNLDTIQDRNFTGAFYGFCGESGVCNSGWCTDCDIGAAAAAPAQAAVARAALR